MTEELCAPQPFPNPALPVAPRYEQIWRYAKMLEGLFWTREAVSLAGDARDWAAAPPEQRRLLLFLLGFFSFADELVMDNIAENLLRRFTVKEVTAFYVICAANERVHAESYAAMILALVDDATEAGKAERDAMFAAVKDEPAVAAMAAWVRRWMGETDPAGAPLPLGTRLFAFALVEGVMFSAAFAGIQWFKEQGLFDGLTTFNEYISRDEGIHCSFACLLLKEFVGSRPAAATAASMLDDLLGTVDAFVDAALPAPLVGGGATLDAPTMKRHVRVVAAGVLGEAGYSAEAAGLCAEFGLALGVSPFPFMNKMLLNAVSKVNFFETRGTQYRQLVGANGWDPAGYAPPE